MDCFNRLVAKKNETFCEKHGMFYSYCYGDVFGSDLWSECPECYKINTLNHFLKKREQQKAELAENKKKLKIESNIQRSGIPNRFFEASFENYIPKTIDAEYVKKKCMQYCDEFDPKSKKNKSIIFCGNFGTGKTHIACAIANYLIEKKDCYVLFTTFSKASRNIKNTYSKLSDQSEQDAINEFTDPDLLIIDEIGVQFGTNSEKLIIFEIINERYNTNKPTILITNSTIENLPGIIGEAVIDRLREEGGYSVAFKWNSERVEKQKKTQA